MKFLRGIGGESQRWQWCLQRKALKRVAVAKGGTEVEVVVGGGGEGGEYLSILIGVDYGSCVAWD